MTPTVASPPPPPPAAKPGGPTIFEIILEVGLRKLLAGAIVGAALLIFMALL